MDWDQRQHANGWVQFEQNIGEYLGLDVVCLSQGELYTVLTYKDAKGKKGCPSGYGVGKHQRTGDCYT
jgi:hypothetical protein